MHDEKYTAKQLVELALAGHYCIRDQIDHAIRKIARLSGQRGCERIGELPDLAAYASESEIDAWQDRLLQLLVEEETRAADIAKEKAETSEGSQLRLW